MSCATCQHWNGRFIDATLRVCTLKGNPWPAYGLCRSFRPLADVASSADVRKKKERLPDREPPSDV